MGGLVAYSVVQLNSSPSVTIDNRTLLSVISPSFQGHHHPIKSTRFKPFGFQAYVINQDASKLQPTASRMIMVGLEPGSDTYWLWDKNSQNVIVSSDV